MLLGGLCVGYGTHQQTCVRCCLYKANAHGPTNSLLSKLLGIVEVSFGVSF